MGVIRDRVPVVDELGAYAVVDGDQQKGNDSVRQPGEQRGSRGYDVRPVALPTGQ